MHVNILVTMYSLKIIHNESTLKIPYFQKINKIYQDEVL